MTDWQPIVLAAVLFVSTGAMGLGPTPDPDETSRFAVDTSEITDDELHEGVQAANGEVVRTAATVEIADLRLEDPDAFEAETGVAPVPDAELRLLAETPAGEIPTDTYFGAQWGPIQLNGPQAWQVTPDDPDVTVGIIDSGINLDHADLPSADIIQGHDYVEGDGTPNDEHGHGTHVAGIVTAIRDNGQGVAGMTQSQLYVVRVADGEGDGSCLDLAFAILEAVDAGVDVLSLSLECPHYPPLKTAIDYAQDNGVPIAASAGNAQLTAPDRCVVHPAAHGETIAVGATDPTLTAAVYSCRGPALELTAPGTGVLSTVPGDAYGVKSGTSMAAPHVAATVALMLDHDPTLTPSQIRSTLNETARDLGEPGHDEAYGHGMVDPVAAMTGLPVFVDTGGFDTDQEFTGPFEVTCASVTGDAVCPWVAASGSGEARTHDRGLASASGTGDATACESVIGDGQFQIFPTCVAASGTGDATGSPIAVTATGDARADCVAVSGTGHADADCNAFGIQPEISGCETVEAWTGLGVLCTDA